VDNKFGTHNSPHDLLLLQQGKILNIKNLWGGEMTRKSRYSRFVFDQLYIVLGKGIYKVRFFHPRLRRSRQRGTNGHRRIINYVVGNKV